MLWPLVLIVLLVGGVVDPWLLWKRTGSNERRKGARPALEVLEERYARGDIDRDEFEQRKSALVSKRTRDK